ncbi:MAG: peptidoglycan editing factor PgeF [Alphaproteobacteria bacterium]|nr:peptidoglycan editing factor PgeF [Alphaproteobacteria bacterium]
MTDPHPPQITDPALAGLDGLRHAFFTRQGGVSKGVYESLNMGYGSNDEPDSIAENRRRAMAAFGLPATALNTVYQIHGTGVALADRNWDPAGAPRADAQVTDRPGIAIGILTADCAPVLFAGRKAAGGPVIGGAHAGWKGAVAGVLAEAVAAMEALGAARATIHAAIGPSIGQDSYEVGPEFHAPFIDQDPANARFFRPGNRDGHSMFDITGYIESRLTALSIAAVGRIDADTCAEPDRFFSYRRTTLAGEPDYGRELSAIVIAG